MKYIYHEVGQALLQSRAVSRYYKVGDEISQSAAGKLLQICANIITKLGSYLTKWGISYFKVGQSLLQSGTGIIKWGNFITEWGRYYKVGQLLKRRPAHLRENRTTFTDRANKVEGRMV